MFYAVELEKLIARANALILAALLWRRCNNKHGKKATKL